MYVLPFLFLPEAGRGLRKNSVGIFKETKSLCCGFAATLSPTPTENLWKTHGIFGKICRFLLLKALIYVII
jgi:hypothetical protein